MATGFNKTLIISNAEEVENEFVPEHIRRDMTPHKQIETVNSSAKQPVATVPFYHSEKNNMPNSKNSPEKLNNIADAAKAIAVKPRTPDEIREAIENLKNSEMSGFPNSGNNHEFTWLPTNSEVNEYNEMAEPKDGEQINYIDNNDYIDGVAEEPVAEPIINDVTEYPSPQAESDCILFIDGFFVLRDSPAIVENHVQQLIYGSSDLQPGAVNPDRIEVFKKMKIKIGVFLE